VLALLAHPLWIGPAGTGLVGGIVPSYTGTDAGLGRLAVNGYSGRFALDGFRLGNPAGGPKELPDAASVGSLSVDVAPLSLLSDEIHVREVVVASPHASTFCIGALNNFAVIGENVEKKLGPKKDKEEKKKSETRALVDHLLVTDVRVDFGTVSALTIPKIELVTVTNVATLVVENFRISNPSDERQVTNAVYVGRLSVTLDWASVFTKKIHVYDITVEDPYVSAYFGSLTSFESFNLLRAFSQVIPPEDGKKDAKKDGAQKAEKDAKAADAEAVKVEIDRISLVRTNCRLLGTDFGGVIKERIEIRDIGKSGKGAEIDTVVQDEVWPRLKKEMGSQFETTWDAFSKTYDMLNEGAGKALTKVLDNDAVKKATGLVGDGAKKVLDNDAAKKTTEIVGDGAKKATEAVGDGAKKAADALGTGLKKLNPFGN